MAAAPKRAKGHRRRWKDPAAPLDRQHRGPREDRRNVFDRLAEGATLIVSSAYFFAGCVAAVVAWALFGPAAGYSTTWQLVVNTGTTIVTFLMVAMLQNSSRRSERAVQHKLNAIADALADFMDKSDLELETDVDELIQAVGLEEREGTT